MVPEFVSASCRMVVVVVEAAAMADSPIFPYSWIMCQEPPNCKCDITVKMVASPLSLQMSGPFLLI